MEKGINYPIKYAVLELKEKGGWPVGYKDIIRGYIVSKCYVMESKISYRSDGTNKVTHKVVFPFTDLERFETSVKNNEYYLGEAEMPRYDACNNPYPVNIVDDLFDTFEEAKISANEKNEELEANLLLNIPSSIFTEKIKSSFITQYKALEKEFKEKLELCYLFEQLLLKKTENMIISEKPSLNKQNHIVKELKPIK